MSLESACARSDALANAVLKYVALRDADPLAAARVRKTFRALADEVLTENAGARANTIPHMAKLSLWTPDGPLPLPPRHDNDEPSLMPGSKA